jgi:hypothetical protein
MILRKPLSIIRIQRRVSIFSTTLNELNLPKLSKARHGILGGSLASVRPPDCGTFRDALGRDLASDCQGSSRFAKTADVQAVFSITPRAAGTMTNILRTSRLAIVIALGWIVVSPSSERLDAADAEAAERDYSAEAEAAYGSSHIEAIRDPELRRHYLDQYDHRRLQQWEPNERIQVEIEQLQHALGGPQVDQFPSLREQGFGAPSAPSRSREARSTVPRDAIRALRDAAAQLDAAANRLEQLELFTQADDLRWQAQRLRVDAREMSGVQPMHAPAPGPRPAAWGESHLNLQPLLDETPPAPGNKLAPPRTPPTPELEPVPQPEIPSDPPNPQPLLDSPEATPQPDVEVEG